MRPAQGVWGSREWRDEAEEWAHRRLDRLGFRPIGAMTDLSDQRWSWVWRIPTNRSNVVLKQTSAARAVEGSVQAFCADIAPEYVDRPLANDPVTARVLFADGGPTMDEDSAPEAIASMVVDYAHLQRASIGRQCQAATAGLAAWDPVDAAREAERQADVLHGLARSDPRHITARQKDLLLARLDALAGSGKALADSSIPSCIDHGDLWPGNVLIARPGGHYRFIDFGDAAWTHPFLSLMQLLFFCHRHWSPTGAFRDDLDQPSLKMIIDSYLQSWCDYGSPSELRETLGHALRLAPLRRCQALITNFDHATAADRDDLGPTPWSWLTATVLEEGTSSPRRT